MDPKDMTLEQLQKALEAHPEFAESLRPLIEAKKDPPAPPQEPPTPPDPTVTAITAESQQLLATMREEREAVQRERAAMTLDRLLAESQLTAKVKEIIRGRIGTALMAESD